jgi:Tfp pilus assembly protein PilW
MKYLVKQLEKNQTGVTLLELLIYVALVSILAVVFVNFTLDIVGTSQKARVKQEAQQNARIALERISRTIREANGLNVGSSTFGSHPGVLSLSMDNAAVNPTVFDISGGVLRITEGVGAPQALTSDDFNVTNLVFTNRSISGRTTNIKTEITVTHPNPQNSEIFDAEVSLRSTSVIREDEE